MHTTFGSSKLVRLMHAWSPVEADAPGPDVAERMSLWFGPLQAIGLQSMYQTVSGLSGEHRPPTRAALQQANALPEDLQRTRGMLARAIAQDPLALAGLKPGDPDVGYPAFHQRHIELQRQMGQMAGALRDHARQTVARVSPRLRQLAAMDAAFEELLAAREQALLPTTAALLERRFTQLRAAHRQALEAAGEPDDPALWRRPGGWLAAFCDDWRQALLAELDLRLEPVAGLVDALRNENPTPT